MRNLVQEKKAGMLQAFFCMQQTFKTLLRPSALDAQLFRRCGLRCG